MPATTREGSLALGTPLLGLPGVGPATAQKLAERELATVGDVLHFLPRRWDDLRQLVPVAALAVGQMAVTRGTVKKARVAFGRGRRILEVTFAGDDGAELGGALVPLPRRHACSASPSVRASSCRAWCATARARAR